MQKQNSRSTSKEEKIIFWRECSFPFATISFHPIKIPPLFWIKFQKRRHISLCCMRFNCFCIDDSFPSVVCFRSRHRPLYRRESEKVFGQNTLWKRKIQPETAKPPDLFAFNRVCTNFNGRARKQAAGGVLFSYWCTNAFLHIFQFVRELFQILTYLLGGYLCVDLGRFYVGMPQQSADGFNWHSIG